MSTHQTPWHLLIDTAREAVDAATEALARAQRRLLDARKQLDMLAGYRDEYLARMAQQRESGMSISALTNQNRFLDQLDQALKQQRENLEQAEAAVAEARHLWQESQRKLKSFDTLAERQQQRLQQEQSRQEQRVTDEHATRQFVTRNRHTP